jgi:hypothetical protein
MIKIIEFTLSEEYLRLIQKELKETKKLKSKLNGIKRQITICKYQQNADKAHI